MFKRLKSKYALTDTGLKSVKQGTICTAITNVVIMFGMFALYLAMQALIGALTGTGELPGIASFAIGLAVFAVALFAGNWLQYKYTYGVVYAESGRQRLGIAEHLRKLPLSFFGKRDVADLTETLLGDVATMEHAYSHVLGELYGAGVSTCIVFIMALAYNWQLAIAAFWSVPCALLLLFATRPLMKPMFDQVRAAGVSVSEKIQETLDCVREIKATNQSERYLAGLNAKIDEAEATMTKGELTNGIIVNLSFVILRLGMPTTLLVGGLLVSQGQIGFMEMFAALLIVSRIYAPFDQCLMLTSELFVSQTSANRMKSIMDEPICSGDALFEPKGHDVAFSNVAFSYAADDAGGSGDGGENARGEGAQDIVSVLKDVSFVAREGEVTALVGPSGAGKSTCARLAARFWDATSGTVRVGGVDVQSIDPESLLKDFSVVFQDVLLFDDTVMGNIRIGKRNATNEEVRAAARAAMCDDFVERLPQGYDTMIGEGGSKLSGGERQRISIARALLKDAPIVLLDEATASLDVENETKIQEAISRLLANKTVIVIAHRMRTVEAADKIVVLKDGVVAEQGAPDDLKRAGGVFAHMVELQKSSAQWAL